MFGCCVVISGACVFLWVATNYSIVLVGVVGGSWVVVAYRYLFVVVVWSLLIDICVCGRLLIDMVLCICLCGFSGGVTTVLVKHRTIWFPNVQL